MALKNGKYLCKIKAKIENVSPFNIGNGEGAPLITLEENEVYLPGTTLAGAFRDYLVNSGEKNIENLFGDNGELSKFFFMDSYSKLIGKEVRDAVAINKELGVSDNKFSRLYVAEGHVFDLRIEIYADCKEDLENRICNILACLKAINDGIITFGSYKTGGAGIFKVNKLEKYEVDLNKKEELFNYLLGNEKYVPLKIQEVTNNLKINNNITFTLKGTLKTGILLKGNEALDCDKADYTGYVNSKGDYIIPGTAIKGVIRAEGERILKYLSKEEDINNLFGGTLDDKKIASKLMTKDSKINNAKTKIYNRIKLNKFTAGTMNGALFNEEVINGNVEIKGILKVSKEEEKYIGLIAMIFRDISLGKISLGSGNSIGRGIINGEELLIRKGEEIIFKGNLLENKISINEIDPYISALWGGKSI